MTQKFYPQLGETVYREQLENGLTVVVVPRPGFQKKLVYFATHYGAIHTRFFRDGKEETAPAGVAHYLEHKLFDMPQGEVSAVFAARGANPNAFTSYDMTAYHFSCTEHFAENLALLVEFVLTPYFTEESVEKEQGIIAQEIDMTADTPENRVFEMLMEAMYREHPIRVPILGTRETIGRITPQVLKDCHSAFYTPENMILCVVGDVEMEQVSRIVKEAIPATVITAAQRVEDHAEPMTCDTHFVSAAMEVAMPMFQLGFKCESAGSGEDAVRAEMVGDLAAEALFGESSTLYQKLYEQGRIDSSFGGGYETVDGMAMLTASGDSNDPEAVRDAILESAKTLCEKGIAKEDFLRMKRSSFGRRLRDLDSFDSTCFRVCAYHFSGFDYFCFPEVYQDISAKEVEEFIHRVVTPARCCLSVIKPSVHKEDTQ